MLDRSDFTILYGSQTGQAKAIAEEIYDNCSTHGLNASIFCLSLIEKKVSHSLENKYISAKMSQQIVKCLSLSCMLRSFKSGPPWPA